MKSSMFEMTALGNSKIEMAAAEAARPTLVMMDTSVDPWSGDVIQTYYRPNPWAGCMTRIATVDRRTFKRAAAAAAEYIKTLDMTCHITPEMQALYDSILPAMKKINDRAPCRMVSGVRARDELYRALIVGDEVRVRAIVVLTRGEWVVWWRAY
jgi:hypothetical protein